MYDTTKIILDQCAKSPVMVTWESAIAVMVELGNLILRNEALRQGLIEHALEESLVQGCRKVLGMMREAKMDMREAVLSVVQLDIEYEREGFNQFRALKRELCGEAEE